jgi:drug/metabolite transporter (DMT)-like permease
VTPRLLPPGLSYLAISVLLFGGVWPLTKHALNAGASGLWFAAARAALAALVTAALLAALGRLRPPARADLPATIAIGLGQLGAFFALTHLALERVPAGRTGILGNVTIIWLVPLSVWLLGERPGTRQWVAVGCGLGGVLLLIAPWSLGAEPGRLSGYLMLLGASFAWTVSILVTRARPPRRPILDLLPWCFGIAGALLLPLAALAEPGGTLQGGQWHALFVGLVAAPIGTWATIEAGRRLSGPLASVGFLLIPAVGVALATLWLGEPLGWELLAGGALILAGVVVAARGG